LPTLFMLVAIAAAIFLLVSKVIRARNETLCAVCQDYIGQIALALENYKDVHGSYPPAYTVDANGKRMHSWRVLILPYLEEERLYRTIRLDEPWDSPANQKVGYPTMQNYCCPFNSPSENTTVFAVHNNGKLGDCVQGGEEFLIIEVPDRPVNWMSPYGDVECSELPEMRKRIKSMGHPGGIGKYDFERKFERLVD
ncbi:MAG: DUF1559 domain-containing protein, partial [Planctomycetota bacterium]|nr:DUF1559 domain-containing protein [Planctomycetota bacterium]